MKETTENHSQESCEVDAGDGALTVSPEETICFTTTRFGDQEAPVDMIVEFPDGLLGFPDCRRFIIVQNPSGGPFQWLQSIDEPGLAFVGEGTGHVGEKKIARGQPAFEVKEVVRQADCRCLLVQELQQSQANVVDVVPGR